MINNSRDWLLKTIEEKNEWTQVVESIIPIEDNLLKINRKEYKPSFTVLVISRKEVKINDIEPSITSRDDIEFVVNIPSDSIWEGGTIDLIKSNNCGWGRVKDLMSATFNCQNVGDYISKEYQFIEDSLPNHSQVNSYEYLSSRLIRIHRKEFSPINIMITNDYEVTNECITKARNRNDDFSLLVFTNPNTNITQKATKKAQDLNIEPLTWGDFFSRLNQE
ncbi:MAG: hypothetical protein HRT47_00740 [Candidatus Caenarcaniphilales bacterium]|nr:hypothetical protein [Candidatus Caenarcaniphilales bacterium]